MRKRNYGQGSIYQRKDGYWVAQIEISKTLDGTRKRKRFVRATRKSATEALAQARKEILVNGSLAEEITLRAWLEEYLKRRATKIRPQSYATEAGAFKKWIIPTLGRRKLSELTPKDVYQLAQDIMAGDSPQGRVTPKSPTTANTYIKILLQALNAAVADGYKVRETVFRVKKPTKAISQRTSIPLADIRQILTVAKQDPLYSRWLAALTLGARQAELLGLSWDRVDFRKGVIDISWQLKSLPYVDNVREAFRIPANYEAIALYKSYHLVRPKTATGTRLIPAPRILLEALETHRETAVSSDCGLVWVSDVGRPLNAKKDLQAWKDLQVRAGVSKPGGKPYDLHEARHSTATLLLSVGVDAEVVKTILGHSEVAMSRAYQHVDLSMAAKAMKRLEKVL